MSKEIEKLFSKANSSKMVRDCINKPSKNNVTVHVKDAWYKYMLPMKETTEKSFEKLSLY